jgi:hypothetical protein
MVLQPTDQQQRQARGCSAVAADVFAGREHAICGQARFPAKGKPPASEFALPTVPAIEIV